MEEGSLPCVLFVDDDQSLQEIVRVLAARRGTFIVETVSSSSEAIQRINHHRHCYDAVITDFELPDLTGVALTTLIRQHNAEIPIAILTEHDDEGIEAQVLAAGADFLTKGKALENFDTFLKTIEALIEGKSHPNLRRGTEPLVPVRQHDSHEPIEIPQGLRRVMRQALIGR